MTKNTAQHIQFVLKLRAILALFLTANLQLTMADELPQDLAETSAKAQPNIVSEDDYIGDVPKVLTVSRLSQSLADAPSAVTVIDRETIRAAGIVDLPEIFRLVPGMYVAANAGFVYSTNHTVSYHGMVNAYAGTMQVLINGRSVYSPLFGGVKWSELPIAVADIERIEITRGPNAASYGANAYFGTINIMTQNASELPANSVISTHGNGRNEVLYRHAGKTDDIGYRFTTGYRQDDGLDSRNDFKRTRFINGQADYQLNLENTIELEFGLAEGARGEGDINQDAIIFVPRTRQMENYNALIRWRHNISESSDFSLQAYHSYDSSDDETTSANLRPILKDLVFKARIKAGDSLALATFKANTAAANLLNDTITINNDVITERNDIEAQHTFAIGRAIRAVWGGSLRQDSMYAPFYLGTKKTDYFNLQRIFGHVELRADEHLTLNAGAMLEHNDFTGTDLSPRASMNFKINPNHAFRLGVSTALRTPNYVEEKFDDGYYVPTKLANPKAIQVKLTTDQGNVNPEHIISREIGYIGKLGRLQLDARIFSDKLSDSIISNRVKYQAPANVLLLNTNSNTDSNTNGGSAAVEGIELGLNWRLANQTRLLLNYAYVNIRETQASLKRDFTDSMPSNTLSALITHNFDSNWDASLAYYQTSKVTALGDGDPVGLTRRVDVRAARKFNADHVQGEVSVVVENLFNSHYQEFADYNTLDRRARINVRLDF